MSNYRSPLERLCSKLGALARANALPLTSGLVFGLLAHMFVITNKLMNADEASAIFSKGATIDSGRWALELLRYVLPDLSLPWLWGIMSIVLITIAACVALRVFSIRHSFFKVLLPALFISFPSLTGTFCFMFTSSAYAIAFLLAVLSVWVFVSVKKRPAAWLIAGAMIIFSVGIYQAYIAITAGFFVILMLQRLMEGESWKKVFAFGVRCVAMLLVSLIIYYIIAAFAVKISGGEFLTYALESETSLLFKIALAYNAFVKSIFFGYFGFVDTPLTFAAHILGLGLCVLLGIRELVRLEGMKEKLLFALCVVLLPLAMNCIFLISSTQIIHSLVLYSFVCIYVLAAVLLERCGTVKLCCLRDVVVLCMLLTVVSNVFVANKVYLKLHLQYENAYSFYTGIITQVYSTEGYNEDKKLVIYGNYDGMPENDLLDTGDLFGPSENLVNIYTRDEFIKNYIGYTGQFLMGDKWFELRDSDELKNMPAYPNEGYIKCIDDCVVVKLG